MLAIKLNMEKSYDRIEWNYIFTTLEKIGFHRKFIEWIKSCITIVSFSILVNGIPGKQFKPMHGLRKGILCPHIYLFILCAELLAGEVYQLSFYDSKDLGVKIGRSGIKISFLTFADNTLLFAKAKTSVDDTLLFAKANSKSCLSIENILDEYCRCNTPIILCFPKIIFKYRT